MAAMEESIQWQGGSSRKRLSHYSFGLAVWCWASLFPVLEPLPSWETGSSFWSTQSLQNSKSFFLVLFSDCDYISNIH